MSAQVIDFPSDLAAFHWDRGDKTKAARQVAADAGIQLGVDRIVAMSNHPSVRDLAGLRAAVQRMVAKS